MAIEPTLRSTILTARVLSRTDRQAAEELADRGIIEISGDRVGELRRQNREEFEALQAKWAPKLEEALANEKLENARKATRVIGKAIEKTEQYMDEGKLREPHRVAGEMSQVDQRQTHTKLALEGRPVRTTATIAELPEIVKRLEQIGVLEPDQPAIEATSEEDESSEAHRAEDD